MTDSYTDTISVKSSPHGGSRLSLGVVRSSWRRPWDVPRDGRDVTLMRRAGVAPRGMTTTGGECKIDRVAERRNLTDIDDRLRRRRADGESLRDLARLFDRAVLESAMRAAGMDPIAGEVENLHRLLTEDGVSPGERVDVEARLRRNGVDPSAVTADFVSHATVRTHLQDCLGVATDRAATPSVADARTTVLKLLSRTESVARAMIERLADRDLLVVPAPTVSASVRVACAECGDEYTFSRLLERGGCSCREA
jgi:hypothetical protein